MSVTDLNHAVRHLCHVVDVCSKLLKVFHDYCLFNMSDEIIVGIAFSCFWLKNYKNIVSRYSMVRKQYFCLEDLLNYFKNGLNAQQWRLHHCKIPHKNLWKLTKKNCVFRLSLGLSTQIMEFKYTQAYKMIETGVLVWKSKNMKSYRSVFILLWWQNAYS